MATNSRQIEDLACQFSEQVTPNNYVDDLLDSVRECMNMDLGFYERLIKTIFSSQEPIFSQKEFAKRFWLHIAHSQNNIRQIVIQDALAEMRGSVGLGKLSEACTFDDTAAFGIRQHSQDEGRHAFLYLELAELCFPKEYTFVEIKQLKANLANTVKEEKKNKEVNLTKEALIDHVIQMNMVEIRTRTNVLLLSPVLLTICPQSNQSRVQEILSILCRDESRHIGYTAQLINDWEHLGFGDSILNLYNQRMEQFSQLTSSP